MPYCADRVQLLHHDLPQCGCAGCDACVQQSAADAAQQHPTDCSHSQHDQHAVCCCTHDDHDDSAPLIVHSHRSSDAGYGADLEEPQQQGSPRSSAAGSGISEHSCDSCSTDGELFEVVVQEDIVDPDAKPIWTQLYVEGLCCPAEAPLIYRILQPLDGVHEVKVAVVTKSVSVHHSPGRVSPAMLVAALNEALLEASIKPARQLPSGCRSWVPPSSTLLAVALLAFSCLHYLALITGVQWLEHTKWVALAAVAVKLPHIVMKAAAALACWVLDINTLMTIAVAGALAIGQYTEAGVVVVLFSVAEFLERNCSRRARDAVAGVLALKPETAVLADSGKEVAADSVPVGTQIVVRPGSNIPIDGTVVHGTSVVDEGLLTGEATPVAKAKGSVVFGGTLNAGSSPLTVETTALASASAVARMAQLVDRAVSEQSPTETLVMRFARVYTPLVVAACIAIAFLPWAFDSQHHKYYVYLSLQLLVTACPCALILSTPVTVCSAVAKAARVGVLVKGGQVLEALAGVQVVSFDKTGTLTRGRCQVAHVQALGEHTEAEVLRLAACVERGSSHPLAAAIVGAAAARGLPINTAPEASMTLQGQGIVARVEGQDVIIGTLKLMAAEGVTMLPTLEAAVQEWQAKGASVVFVALEGQLAGFVAFSDAIRPEAPAAVAALQASGVRCAMFTGDGAAAATAAAAAVGIPLEDTHWALLPEDKLAMAHAYRTWRAFSLAHVGDGVNDAPVLAAANVGVAMGAAGADVAVDSADVVLFTTDLRRLGTVMAITRSARRKIMENIACAVSAKLAVVILASLGRFSLWGAVLVDALTAIAVIFNGMCVSDGGQTASGCGGGECCSSSSGSMCGSQAAAGGTELTSGRSGHHRCGGSGHCSGRSAPADCSHEAAGATGQHHRCSSGCGSHKAHRVIQVAACGSQQCSHGGGDAAAGCGQQQCCHAGSHADAAVSAAHQGHCSHGSSQTAAGCSADQPCSPSADAAKATSCGGSEHCHDGVSATGGAQQCCHGHGHSHGHSCGHSDV